MHEMSIAMGIVQIAENEAVKANMRAVKKIELEIGTLAGIELDALEFVWSSAVEGSVLEKAAKHITVIQGKAQCKDCNTIFKLDQIFDVCPNCGSYLKSIKKGKELLVKSLELTSQE